MDSNPRQHLRRKSSSFKLSLGKSTADAYRQALAAPPATPSLPSSFNLDTASSTPPQQQPGQLDFELVSPPRGSPSPPSKARALPSAVSLAMALHPASSSSSFASSSTPLLSSAASIASTATGNTSVGSVPNVPSASLSNTLEGLRGLVGKRITAWTYLKNAGEGKVYWFNTVLLTTEDMRSTFTNEKMRSRTIRFAVLGMSLSSLLDISPAHDFLRSLLSLVQEFESVPEERFGGRNVQKSLFKVGSKSRRGGGLSAASAASGGADFSMGLPQEGGEASYLLTPNIPFELDYFQVLITTCEMLVEVYTKIFSYLGPSSSLSSSAAFPQPPGSRTSLAAPVALGGAGAGGALSQSLTEVVYKVDARLKKLISMLSKEIDTLARAAIKTELNNLGGADYGLDGME
ncbi:hypothetical protein JCM6882_006678 [Rhodosporidiobolus microsporus]